MSKAMTFRHGPDTSSSRVPALSLTMTANSLRRQRRLRRRALRGPAELGQQPELVEEDLDLGGLAALEPRYDRDRRSNGAVRRDRKSTRLNSSHMSISYAVFCLKKKKTIK